MTVPTSRVRNWAYGLQCTPLKTGTDPLDFGWQSTPLETDDVPMDDSPHV